MKTTLPLLVIALAALVLSFSATAHAGRTKNRLYGWELEFTNRKVYNAAHGTLNAQANSTNDAAREKWMEIVRKLCKERGDCRMREIEDWISWRKSNGEVVWSYEIASFRFTFKDGFWFQLSLDPGVVEVQVKPSTLEDFERLEDRIQEYIFDTALEAGLRPKKNSETHLHIGADAAFGMSLRLIRDFLVDGVNHPEWTLLFANGLENAPPLMVLPEGKYEAFRKIVAAVDAGEITTVEEFVRQVRRKVYDVTYEESFANEFDLAQKFQQWNIERLKKKWKTSEKTFEHRATPAPQAAADMTSLVELFDARIELILKRKGKPIALAPRPEKLSKREQVLRFREYVAETGLEPREYRRFLKKSCASLLTRR